MTISGGRYEYCLPSSASLKYPHSHLYVKRIVSRLPPSQLHLSTPIRALETTPDGKVLLKTAGGKEELYDHVILACHSDTSLAILDGGEQTTPKEREILGSFGWNKNEAVLHCDTNVCARVQH